MMLQEQTCTKDQALRLVALGVKPEAQFWHMPAKDGPHSEYVQYGWHGDALAPAYNGAELDDMLPVGSFQFIDRRCFVSIEKGLNGTYIYIKNYDKPEDIVWMCFHKVGVQAKAYCLYLILQKNPSLLPEHWRQDPNDPCADGRCQRGYSPCLQEIQPLPEPTHEECNTPAFEAAYQVMRDWTIQAPRYYKGSMDARGGHVKLLVDAIVRKNPV